MKWVCIFLNCMKKRKLFRCLFHNNLQPKIIQRRRWHKHIKLRNNIILILEVKIKMIIASRVRSSTSKAQTLGSTARFFSLLVQCSKISQNLSQSVLFEVSSICKSPICQIYVHQCLVRCRIPVMRRWDRLTVTASWSMQSITMNLTPIRTVDGMVDISRILISKTVDHTTPI